MNKELIVIAGPTGIGKTDLGIKLAKELKTEIISADSRQIYKELSIGTAVPRSEQLQEVPHHFIHTKSIHEYYNASRYETEVLKKLNSLFTKHNRILMVGGSGMYIDAVRNGIDELPEVNMSLRKKLFEKLETEGLDSLTQELKRLDPESWSRIDLKNPKRVQKALEVSMMTGKPYSAFLQSRKKEREFSVKLIALDMDRKKLYDKINARVIQMMDSGWIKECILLKEYRNTNALNTVGYKEIFKHLDGLLSLPETIERIQANTRKYARKQLTWFRKEKNYRWFHPEDYNHIINFILND